MRKWGKNRCSTFFLNFIRFFLFKRSTHSASPTISVQLIGVLADKCSVISARHLTRQVGLANYFFRISVGSAHQLIN